MRVFCPACFLCVMLLVSVPGAAALGVEDEPPATNTQADVAPAVDPREKDPAAGHSYHGEAFNQGPRQKAYLMAGTGNVHLEITSRSPEAQKYFDQGIGQIHGFWYFEAERSFRQAAALDPDCAMCYLGMALANFDNGNRNKKFMAKAVELKNKASRREQLWIDAFNAYLTGGGENKNRWRELIRSLERLGDEFPDELEAKAFLAWAVWAGDRAGLPHTSHKAVDALIEQVLRVNPMHPVHHYRIHLWDYEKAEKALPSAALCGQSAPGIAHMWHMSGHIYWRVRRYHDSAWQQEASARVDHAFMMRDRVMPYQIHNYAHNNEWLTRSLAHVGRVHDAIELARNMMDIPRHPKQNALSNRGSSAYFGRTRLMDVLHRFELWDETIALAKTPYLEPANEADEDVRLLRMIGRALLAKGDVESGKAKIAELDAKLQKISDEQEAAGAEAEKKAKDEKKPDADVQKARDEARRKHEGKKRPVETALRELRGRLAMAEGKHDEGIALLEQAGDVLKEHLSLDYLAAGKLDKAEEAARQAKDGAPHQMQPLANYAYVLYRCGKIDQAKEAFAKLRTEAGMCDLDVPAFARLAPLAKELGLSEDWRLAREEPKDVGVRPPLDSLGPFRWQGVPAPEFSLSGIDGCTESLKVHHGKPVVLIFYLGHGCLHCMEQLKKFGPMTEEFRQAGIDVVAVSTDAMEDLQKSADVFREGEKPGVVPFPIVADPGLAVFKQYRCFDDFEGTPLHGTFLVDGDGLIRWQDVSFEPFMEAPFLLGEAKRLLAR
jgi:peroxiredoxin